MIPVSSRLSIFARVVSLVPGRKKQVNTDRLDRAVAEARRDHERRVHGFRERALKLFPWICARCGREFSRHNLRELTVHHKDHDHDNNPPDGSNWELLCLYCHDREHAHGADEEGGGTGERRDSGATYRPFAQLDALLNEKK